MTKVDSFGLCLNYCWFIFTAGIYLYLQIKSINLKIQTSHHQTAFISEFVKLAKLTYIDPQCAKIIDSSKLLSFIYFFICMSLELLTNTDTLSFWLQFFL